MRTFLIGMPGSGKSTLGRKLGKYLKVSFLDLDALIEEEEGIKIRDIFKVKGEEYFRAIEKEQLEKVINAHPSFVLATGGGTPCFFDNLQKMKQAGKTVFLNIGIENLAIRLQKEGLVKRPLLKDFDTSKQLEEYLSSTFNKRRPFYEQADLHLSNDQSIEAMVEVIGAEVKK